MAYTFNTTERNIEIKKGVNNGFFDKYVSNPTNNIIFTRNDVVEKVLDTVESQDPDAFNSITKKYCDIGCKSGAYLCGIAERIFNSPKAKELYGEGKELARWRHIFRYQIFGVTSNKVLQRVSQMRVYNICDKDGENLFDDCWCNIISTDLLGDPSKFEPEDIMKRFNEIENFTTVEDFNKYGEKEIKKMAFEKFDYIIGNPPYQIQKGGTKNVDIWPSFIEKGATISNKMCIIHPGRWVNPKKQMEKVRDMIIDNGLAYFDYYPYGAEVFEDTVIGGGISITYFDKGSNTTTYSVRNEFKGTYTKTTKIFENAFEEEAFVKMTCGVQSFIEKRVMGNAGSLNINEFGFDPTSMRNLLKASAEECTSPIKVWANAEGGKGAKKDWCFIDRGHLDTDKYAKITNSRKIMFSKNGHQVSDGGYIINNDIVIVDKEVVGANVFFAFPENDTDYELNLLKSFFETKTVRFLMSITQKDVYTRGFENVPDYTYFIDELNGELFTDEFFYNKYNFSSELIKYIEANIAEK